MTDFDIVFLAGEHDRPSGPAKIKLPVGISTSFIVKIIAEEENMEFPGYITPISKKESELYIIVPPLKKGQEFETSVTIDEKNPMKTSDFSEEIGIVGVKKLDEHHIKIEIDGKEFTTYNYNTENANRPYLYPLMAPFGVGVTRNWPIIEKEGDTTDHIHHKSCWTAWGDLNGTDNWGDGNRNGHQITDEISLIEENIIFGRLKVKNRWTDKKGNDQLSETRDMIFYNLKDIRIIDFNIILKSLSGDIRFGDTKEGGFLAVRVATSMDVPRGGKIENSIGGIGEEETWGKRAQWCDYSGNVEGKNVGVAIFDNSDNYMFPTYWHVRNYGLMAANPLGISYFLGKPHDGSIILKMGDEMAFKYRLIVHDGDKDSAKLSKRYLNYYIPWKIAVFKN